jgi:hypothetical protein
MLLSIETSKFCSLNCSSTDGSSSDKSDIAVDSKRSLRSVAIQAGCQVLSACRTDDDTPEA